MRKDDFDLRSHIESAGHSADTCFHLSLTEKTCRGYLVKMGGKIKTWKKRWFVFDRNRRTLSYYAGEPPQRMWREGGEGARGSLGAGIGCCFVSFFLVLMYLF